MRACQEVRGENVKGFSEWDETSTVAIIALVVERKDRFEDPSVKNRDLWVEIASHLHDLGFHFSASMCDSKWRHLKSRYYELVDFMNRTKKSSVKWHYFGTMQEAMENISSKQLVGQKPVNKSLTSDKNLSAEEKWTGSIEMEQQDTGAHPSGVNSSEQVHEQTSALCSDSTLDSLAAVSTELLEEESVNRLKNLPENETDQPEKGADSKRKSSRGMFHPCRKNKGSLAFRVSQEAKFKVLHIPARYRGFAHLFKTQQHKTRKVMKALLKEQEKSTALFERLLCALEGKVSEGEDAPRPSEAT
ncbi:hypothetical protein PoB_003117000 [Plakobranchus ocellatus]|uniref:Myb/SANT-like DNA-binding domain-containing protein n=1 Tax=Plakobranchus ocellatus TaxID=259542 RepID=A0AAV4ACV2_9GAST|nr:hypothetical protein PoB_003117000 [Plakobranchus ocellatus]